MTGRPCHRLCLRDLRCNAAGVTSIEFALIAPVFFFFLIGSIDLAQAAYGSSVLNGAVQKAARDSTLETSNTTVADNMVKGMISPILPGATLTSVRTSYYDFVDVGRPEKWNDSNNNGICDNGETYVDENENNNWDSDVGIAGNGGANDVIVYSVTVKYKTLIDVPIIPRSWINRTLKATTIKKNQPFANQHGYGSTARICI